MRSPARALGVLVAAAAVVICPASPAAAGEYRPDVTDDFDCDGVRDTVFQLAYESAGGVSDAGSVSLVYSGTGVQVSIDQASPGVPGTPEKWDMFGWTHSSFDDNGDGCDDLVVSAPDEAVGDRTGAGAVYYLRGGTWRVVDQDTPGVPRAEA